MMVMVMKVGVGRLSSCLVAAPASRRCLVDAWLVLPCNHHRGHRALHAIERSSWMPCTIHFLNPKSTKCAAFVGNICSFLRETVLGPIVFVVCSRLSTCNIPINPNNPTTSAELYGVFCSWEFSRGQRMSMHRMSRFLPNQRGPNTS